MNGRWRRVEVAFDEPADQVLDRQVRLLNVLGIRARYRDRDVRQGLELTAGAGQNDRPETRGPRVAYGPHDVG